MSNTPDSAATMDLAVKSPAVVIGVSSSRKCFLMGIVVLVGLVNSFGNNTALIGPRIQKDLGFSTDELQWLGTSFFIPLGCFNLISGKLADIYGGKRTCIVGQILFTLASLGACFVQSKETLFLTRGISGLGSALATVAGFPLIVGIFEDGMSRTLAQGVYIAAWPTGGAISLVALGFFAEKDWHRFFYLLTGLMAATTLVVIVFLPDQPAQRDRQTHLGREIDWLGGLLSIAGLMLIFYVLAVAPGAKDGWATPHIIVLLVMSVLLLASFAAWQWFTEKRTKTTPLVPLGVFALDKGRISLLFLICVLCFSGWSGFLFLMTLYLEVYLKLSLKKTSLHFLPSTISGIMTNVIVGLAANRVPPQWILMTGAISTGIALVLLAATSVGASYWTYTFWAMALSCIGADCAGSAGLIYITRQMTGAKAGLAGGLYGTFIQLGYSLGPSVGTIGLRYISQANAKGRQNNPSGLEYDDAAFPPSSYLVGLQHASWIVAGMTLFGMFVVPSFALWLGMKLMKLRPVLPLDCTGYRAGLLAAVIVPIGMRRTTTAPNANQSALPASIMATDPDMTDPKDDGIAVLESDRKANEGDLESRDRGRVETKV